MSLVRLLGFTTLACGCVVGRYREVATSREVSYVEEKGKSCGSHGTAATTRSSATATASAPLRPSRRPPDRTLEPAAAAGLCHRGHSRCGH